MKKTNNKKEKKQKPFPLRKALNSLDKDFDEKIKMLLTTPPIKEKDIKKKSKK